MDEGPQWYPCTLIQHFLLFPMWIINLSSSPEMQNMKTLFFSPLSFWLNKQLQQILRGPRLPFCHLYQELNLSLLPRDASRWSWCSRKYGNRLQSTFMAVITPEFRCCCKSLGVGDGELQSLILQTLLEAPFSL